MWKSTAQWDPRIHEQRTLFTFHVCPTSTGNLSNSFRKMVAADFLQNGQRLKARRQKVIPANMFLHLAALPWRNVFHLLLNLVPDDHSKLFSVGPFHVVLSWQKSYSQKSKNQDD